MSEWWATLDVAGKIFACIAFPSTILLVIQIIYVIYNILLTNLTDT